MRKIKATLLSIGIVLFGGGVLTMSIDESTYSFGVGMSIMGTILLVSGIGYSWYVEYKEKKDK
jgi:hypothetical protein